MKKNKVIRCTLKCLSLALLVGTIIFSTSGCKKTSDTTTSVQTIKELVTNGTIIPISRDKIKGILFIVDESGKPIQGITSSNVVGKLKWVHLKSVKSDSASVGGLVVVTGNNQNGIKVAAGITMDYSGSMSSIPTVIQSMEHGVKTFVRSMAPTDLGEIIKFSNDVFVAQQFTNDTSALIAGINNNNFNLFMNTALYQSIYQGLTDVSNQDMSQYIRSVIGFTDGGENYSSISESEMLDFAISHGIPINTIGFLTTDTDTTDLRYIAESTGGFFFLAVNDSTFAKIYSTISGQLKNSYSYTVQWQGTLPPSGTPVTATITTTYQNHQSSFHRTFYLP